MDITTPTRQSAKGIILFSIIGFRKTLRNIWPLLLIYVVKLKNSSYVNNTLIITFVCVLLALIIIHSVLHYLNFLFFVNNNELIVKKGYIKKTKLSIPIDRIQTVNIKQNLIQQALGVVSLEIDTAGTSGKELEITAIDKEFAGNLKQEILSNKNDDPVPTESIETVAEEADTIVKLDFIDLLKIGISENHLKSFGIILAFGIGTYEQIKDYFNEEAKNLVNSTSSYIEENQNLALISLFIVFVLIISISFSLVKVILTYFDLKFFKSSSGFVVESGLTKKKSVSILNSKIQVLSWSTNPIRKLMNFVNVRIHQVSGFNFKREGAIVVPACTYDNLNQVNSAIFNDNNTTESDFLKPEKGYLRRNIIILSLLQIPLVVLSIYKPDMFYIPIIWVILTIIISVRKYRNAGYSISENHIIVRSGVFEKTFSKMELYKVQNISFHQPIIQKSIGIANIKIVTAGNKTIRIPYIKEAIARQIADYSLFKCESSHDKWF